MKKIDWYILKRFLVSFFSIITMLAFISCVIDVSEKSDDFVKARLDFGEILKYYGGFLPHIIALLFPLFVFIAVIFFTSKMAMRSEFIAIISSGVSFNRMLRPYVMGGIFLGSLLWVSVRYLVPKSSVMMASIRLMIDKVNNDPSNFKTPANNYFRIDSSTYAGLRGYDDHIKSGYPFFLNKIQGNQVVYYMRADNIVWDTAKKVWNLTNVVERRVDTMGELITQSIQKQVKYNFVPNDFLKDEYQKEKLTTPQLESFIKKEELKGNEGINKLKVERYKRDAIPFAVLILTLMGAIIAYRKVRGGSGIHLAIGLSLAAFFEVMNKFSTVFASYSSFPPLLAAWTPNIIFSIVTFYLYMKAPK